MAADRGWAGTMGQVLHYLRIVGADRDEDGKFLVDGSVYSFLGMSGDGAEVVIPADTCYVRGGQPCGLAAGLGGTSYGCRPIVIA